MIEAGASGVHYEDQLAAAKKCGHMGGKVLVPTSQFIQGLNAARLAADVLDVPTLLVARTDSLAATLLTTDVDERDKPFLAKGRTSEGFYNYQDGMASAIARGLAYAPYADLLWMETSKPTLEEAKVFAEAMKKEFPNQMLAYNCSPSFNWKGTLDVDTIGKFQQELAAMGYNFQFITLAGWHTISLRTFEFAHRYKDEGMTAYMDLQETEFAMESKGFTAHRHQMEVGTGYFDEVLNTITGGEASTGALSGSTESDQFKKAG